MKIYDTFTFFNELDLLEIRLNILDPVVDQFVLVEATRTFQNGEKPLFFADNKERFSGFLHKIIHVIVDDMPDSKETRILEAHQRNAIARGLSGCLPSDQVLLSDLDEIPRPEAVLRAAQIDGVKAFRQSLHYYYIDYVCDELAGLPWTVMASAALFSAPQNMRNLLVTTQAALMGGAPSGKVILVDNGGWHFSYLGGLEAILCKLKSFADPEYNKPEYRDEQSITSAMASGEDLFGRNLHFRKLPVDEYFPKYLRNNRNRFGHLFHD